MNTIQYQEQQRKILVNDLTDELLATDYDPFAYMNFIEAMQNLDDSALFILSVLAGSLNNIPDNSVMKEMMADGFLRVMRDYWERLAREQAEKQIPCAEQLDEDERAGI